ncbi:conserved unknown protein [Ectocarpus siliculosus]|uniref:Palmitoyltransferase n=1 Tax=Ectocarpus siliculosus TaxID=2880 RepID=D7FXG9_ECTSI|nr:conserved unknown protein [Ectocarpus siliculosus]|eukprot:CBJ32306.1 conserved unknown protein [Ectocarpus siliculosus]
MPASRLAASFFVSFSVTALPSPATHTDLQRCTFRMRDHHCVWVGQCVAERNRRSFLGFLILLAGMSFWFSRREVMALSSGETGACPDDGRACKQAVWPHVLRHLLRTNRGGEDVGVAIYVLTAGLLATALAAQEHFTCTSRGSGVVKSGSSFSGLECFEVACPFASFHPPPIYLSVPVVYLVF